MKSSVDWEESVTVVIRNYNRRQVLRRALGSVRAESGRCSILIVDDGSTFERDFYSDLDAEFSIEVMFHERNRGPAAAYNSAIKRVTTEYIVFLDSDDELLPGYFTHLVGRLSSLPYLAMVYCPVFGQEPVGISGCNAYTDVLLAGRLTGLGGMCARTKVLKSVGPLPERNSNSRFLDVCEDDELCFRIARNYCVQEVPIALYRVGPVRDNVTLDKDLVAQAWVEFYLRMAPDFIANVGTIVLATHLARACFEGPIESLRARFGQIGRTMMTRFGLITASLTVALVVIGTLELLIAKLGRRIVGRLNGFKLRNS